jgi:nitroreductase
MNTSDPISLDCLLQSRRSIRKYSQQIPSDELVSYVVNAACLAPSPSDSRPFRFVRIRSANYRALLCTALEAQKTSWLDQIATKNLGSRTRNFVNAYYRYSSFVADAPVLLAAGVVPPINSFSRALCAAGLQNVNPSASLAPEDISLGMALMAFSLKAHELGLASCVLTAPLVFLPNLAQLLRQDNLLIRSLLTLGYPDECPSPKRPNSNNYLLEL